jgi:hypothetical protein
MVSEYERTKWIAPPDRRADATARSVITTAGRVTGADDTAPSAACVDLTCAACQSFCAKSGLTWAHVDDIADGRVWRWRRASRQIIFVWPSLTHKEAMQIMEKITDIPAPKICRVGWPGHGARR